MNALELSLEQGNITHITTHELNLNSSPAEVLTGTLPVEKLIPKNKMVKHIQIRNANFEEGNLNIYTCRFEHGKCNIYIFGNLKKMEINNTIVLTIDNLRTFDILNEKIKYILSKSKTILKSYYNDSKIKSIEYHMMSFLGDLKL
ncbi:MAG: hypothetical protein ACXVPQ_06030 [Bacteroidia bacterium]